jgi:hypothetical protein
MLGISFSCTPDEEITACKAVDQLWIQQSCYDPTKGLTLTASGFGKGSDGLVWSVYVSKDTTINDVNFLKLRTAGLESIIVPDSILSDNPIIHVQVDTNCKGVEMHSIYFSFLRRQINNCTTWVEQRI